MITIEMPLDQASMRDMKKLDQEMKKLGVRYDTTKEYLAGMEKLVKGQMRSFRHPTTKGMVSSTIRRQSKGLVLSVQMEEEHRDALAKHLGIS